VAEEKNRQMILCLETGLPEVAFFILQKPVVKKIERNNSKKEQISLTT
jgi:hypothetical protein